MLNLARKDVAAADLYNTAVGLSDPRQLHKEKVREIAQRNGVSVDDERFMAELKGLYEKFVLSVIPPGNEPLTGNEAATIAQFKDLLGLEDDDAASAHIEVGRKVFRQRLETGSKESASEERQTFQKLVYVSSLVFGEKAKFLLPWKRLFKITDSQVDVAIRNNAQQLFQDRLSQTKAEPNAALLQDLRRFQLQIKLSDEIAADLFRAEARKKVESFIESALEILKARTRVKDIRKVIASLDEIRAYNAALAELSQQFAEGEIVPGVGPVSVFGGGFDEGRQMDDLKLLFRTYVTEALNADRLEESQTQAFGELRNVFGMGKKEAEDVAEEVTAKVYRKRLAVGVTSGELDAASSKAEYLQVLCDKLAFDPEKAAQIHEEIYRQKLQQCLQDNELSDADVAALLRLRVLLCVPKAAVDKAHAEICGGIFAKIVDDAIGAGVEGYDAGVKATVQNAVKGLRLPQSAALEIAAKAVKSIFLTYIKRARSTMGRSEAARELKKMILFSNLTVSQLLDDIKGEKRIEEAKPEEEEVVEVEQPEEQLYDDEVPMMQSMRKVKDKQLEGKAQKEISVKDELDLRERLDLYRTFLLFCLQGDTSGMPMGMSLVVKKDASDFVRLRQLGDILGLSPVEIASVHQGLGEQTFRAQAQTLLSDGQLSKARAEQLKGLQKQLGLPDAVAQKVIQSITSTKMAGAIDQAVKQGRLSVDDIKQLRESGVNIESMVSKTVRTQMFKKLVEQNLSKGTGEFDEKEIFELLPKDLSLEEEAAKRIAKEIARERVRSSLIQSVSLLRQKKPQAVVGVLNDLIACDKVDRTPEPLKWAVKEELLDLYSLFLAKNDRFSENAVRLRELLDIEESTAASLAEMVSSGGFSLETAAEENFVF